MMQNKSDVLLTDEKSFPTNIETRPLIVSGNENTHINKYTPALNILTDPLCFLNNHRKATIPRSNECRPHQVLVRLLWS